MLTTYKNGSVAVSSFYICQEFPLHAMSLTDAHEFPLHAMSLTDAHVHNFTAVGSSFLIALNCVFLERANNKWGNTAYR